MKSELCFEYYLRQCRRCDRIYKTVAKWSRICDYCKKPTAAGNNYSNKNEVDIVWPEKKD